MTQVAKLQKAQALIDLGRYEPAIGILIQCLEERTLLVEVHLRLIICYINLDKYEEAERHVKLGLQEDPNRSEILYLYSFICHLQEKFPQAFQHIEAALRIEPTRVKYLVHLATLYIDTNKYQKALEYLRVAEQHDPEDIEMLIHMADLARVKGDKKESFSYLQRGLAINPNHPTLLSLKSRVLGQSSATMKEAEAEALEALRLNPNDDFAKATLLEVLKRKNGIFRFFVANSFNRYNVQWSVGRVLIAILCWKGVFIWGGMLVLYLMLTWYCGVLFNTFLRRHRRYKYLLKEAEIKQSNFFLGMNGLLVASIIGLSVGGVNPATSVGLIIGLFATLLIGLSYFEIEFKKGRTQFAVVMGVTAFFLVPMLGSGIILGVLSILVLLVYAFCFTLMIAFR